MSIYNKSNFYFTNLFCKDKLCLKLLFNIILEFIITKFIMLFTIKPYINIYI